MRRGLILLLILPVLSFAQDFTGTWLWQSAQSQLAALPSSPDERIVIQRDGGKYTCAACGTGGWAFTTDRKSTETRTANLRNSVAAKWEGDALVVNVMVIPSSGQQYSVMDHWKLSRNGNRLTIRREFLRGSTSESTLIYTREGASDPPAAATPVPETPAPTVPVKQPEPAPAVDQRNHVLEAGARLPLRSLSAFSSKSAQEGDRVYLETAQPVSRFGKLLLPTGTQITATVAFAQGARERPRRADAALRIAHHARWRH